MIPQPPAPRDSSLARLVRRLDRVCGELNAVLLAVAIGLAALDAVCVYGVVLAEVESGQVGSVAAAAHSDAAIAR